MVIPFASSFPNENQDLIIAIGVLVGAGLLIAVIDRVVARRLVNLAETIGGGRELSRSVTTRVTFARRIVEALIMAVAISVALAQLGVLGALGTAILASSAITAAVLGLAARQTLANAIAGLMIAISQPIRIGDLVTVEGQTGTVEDIGLVYTWLRAGSDARVLVPNERLATAVVRNDTIRSPTVGTEATVWVDVSADSDAALSALQATGHQARISGMTHEGIELLLVGGAVEPSERLATEARMRAEALAALRAAGVR